MAIVLQERGGLRKKEEKIGSDEIRKKYQTGFSVARSNSTRSSKLELERARIFSGFDLRFRLGLLAQNSRCRAHKHHDFETFEYQALLGFSAN